MATKRVEAPKQFDWNSYDKFYKAVHYGDITDLIKKSGLPGLPK